MSKRTRASAKGSRAIEIAGAAAGVVAAAVGLPMIRSAATQPLQPPDIEASVPATPIPDLAGADEPSLPKFTAPTLNELLYSEQSPLLSPRFFAPDASADGLSDAFNYPAPWSHGYYGFNRPDIWKERDRVIQAHIEKMSSEAAAKTLDRVEVACPSRLAEARIEDDFSSKEKDKGANPLAALAPGLLAGFLVETVVKAALELIVESIGDKLFNKEQKVDQGTAPSFAESLIERRAMSQLKYKILSERYGDPSTSPLTLTSTIARRDPSILTLNRYLVLAAGPSASAQSIRAATARASAWLPRELDAIGYPGDPAQLAETSRRDADALMATLFGDHMVFEDRGAAAQ